MPMGMGCERLIAAQKVRRLKYRKAFKHSIGSSGKGVRTCIDSHHSAYGPLDELEHDHQTEYLDSAP